MCDVFHVRNSVESQTAGLVDTRYISDLSHILTGCVCVCVCVCARALVRLCAFVHVRAWVRALMCVFLCVGLSYALL